MPCRRAAVLKTCSLLTLLMMLASVVNSQPLPSPEAEAADTIWHVEVLLFAHRHDDIAWREQDQLQDFSQLPVMPAVLSPTAGPVLPGAADSIEPFASEQMAQAWHKMQNEYDLLAYYRWNQLTGSGQRWRVHGDQILAATDQETGPQSGVTPTGSVATAVAGDTMPQPPPWYVLDGSVRIDTDRVGTAEFNIQERSRVLYFRGAEASGTASAGTARPTQAYRIRTLQQRRRIQAGRMEYFDSSGLAALVLISELPAAIRNPDLAPGAVPEETGQN